MTGHGYPETCHACGQRIYTSRQSFQHHAEAGAKLAWHITCPPPWKETKRMEELAADATSDADANIAW